MRLLNSIVTGLAFLVFYASGSLTAAPVESFADAPPPPLQEFRGLWVATVKNIDWPSLKATTTQQQQAELIAILDRAVLLRLNAIVLQVRPNCDALYDSKIEPWSEYLTGRLGRRPSPYYDPLEFAVTEAHKRGLELHAWFNPYRVRLGDEKSPIPANHILRTHPELVRRFGPLLWLDPALPATREYSLRVIMDVVHRYDIDGVHFDDYFYPYPDKVAGKDLEFPDYGEWTAYRRSGGKLPHEDWRRENIDTFVHEVYGAIKAAKPWVKFGVSPFGIWRPHNPPQISGFDAYASLFADSRRWLSSGWVDYLAPQLYWPIDQKAQSFGVLLQWWVAQNSQKRHLWPGMRISGWPNLASKPGEEAVREIQMIQHQAGAGGEILWNAGHLMRQVEIDEALARHVYTEPALVPPSPWLGSMVCPTPSISEKTAKGQFEIQWRSAPGEVWQWLVRERIGDHWTIEILSADKTSLLFKSARTAPEVVTVCAVNRYGGISSPAVFGHSGMVSHRGG